MSGRVECPYCDRDFHPNGIKRHITVKHKDQVSGGSTTREDVGGSLSVSRPPDVPPSVDGPPSHNAGRDTLDETPTTFTVDSEPGGVGKDTPDPATPPATSRSKPDPDRPATRAPESYARPADGDTGPSPLVVGEPAPVRDRSKPRIAALVHFAAPHRLAGSETMLAALMDDWANNLGAECRVFTTAMPEQPGEWQHGSHTVESFENQNTAVAALKAWEPDLIVTHHDNTERGVDTARRLGVPSIVLVHNEMFHTRQLIRKLRQHVGLWVVNNEWTERRAFKGQPQAERVVVNPPIREVGPVEGDPRGVTLVNLNRDKGVGTFYALAAHMPNYRFLGVRGSHGRQQERDQYSNVEFVGPTAHMRRDVWAHTKVLLMPSVYESFGMVALEAAAHGIPTIAHPAGGLRQALGDAGIWLNRNATRRWALKIEELFNDDDAYEVHSYRAMERAGEVRAINDDQRAELRSRIQGMLSGG